MENPPHLACAGPGETAKLSPMHPVVSRVDSFSAADLPIVEASEPVVEKPVPVEAAVPAPSAKPVRRGKPVNHLAMMKALASRPRLAALELFLDGASFTPTALQTPMRMPIRQAIDHLKILCAVGVLQRRTGEDKRTTEYSITPGLVRKAEDGSAIFDFGSGQLHFPHVRLPE